MKISDKKKREIKAHILQLRLQGYRLPDIAMQVGITLNTIYRWKHIDEVFNKALGNCAERYAQGFIESKLFELASGVEEIEETERYTKEILVNGEPVPCVYERKIRRKAPNAQALAALSNKYASGQYDKPDPNAQHSTLHIKITQRDRSLTTAERLKLLEAEGHEVVEVSDFKYLDPPTSGEE